MEDELGTRTVHDPDKVIATCNHASQSPSKHASNIRIMMRSFAQENGIIFYGNGDGMYHQIVLERCAAPYKIIIGADSHTCTYGTLGTFATGMGSADMAAIMAYGKAWLKVPTSYRIKVAGNPITQVYSTDVFPYPCGKITADGATYMLMEFFGDLVDAMSVESRAIMIDMAIEAGGKCGLCTADEKTHEFLARYGRNLMLSPPLEILKSLKSLCRRCHNRVFQVPDQAAEMIYEPDKKIACNMSESKGMDVDRILSIILIIVIILAIVMIVYVIVTPKQGEKFTEFYILGKSRMADNYPTDMAVGDEGEVIIGVVNHEYDSITYWLEVKLNETVIGEEELCLEHGETWEQLFFFEVTEKGEDRKVEFSLYRDHNVSDETEEAYRSLHLWVDVE